MSKRLVGGITYYFIVFHHYVLATLAIIPQGVEKGMIWGSGGDYRGQRTVDREPYRSTGNVNVEWNLALYPNTRMQTASC